jgi:hypothetical protein
MYSRPILIESVPPVNGFMLLVFESKAADLIKDLQAGGFPVSSSYAALAGEHEDNRQPVAVIQLAESARGAAIRKWLRKRP